MINIEMDNIHTVFRFYYNLGVQWVHFLQLVRHWLKKDVYSLPLECDLEGLEAKPNPYTILTLL